MGIYRLSNRVVSGIWNVDCRMRLLSSAPGAVACAVLRTKKPAAKNPLRTADTTIAVTLTRRRSWVLVFALILFAVAPLSISAGAKNRSAMQVPGYRAVRVYYGPLNKMIMSVRINGQPANLLVDTGSNQLILRRRSSTVIRRQAIATWSALHPVHQDSGPIIAGWFRAKHVRWQHEFWQQLGHAAQVIACGRCKCRFRWRSGPGHSFSSQSAD
jgi:hypothetical protein